MLKLVTHPQGTPILEWYVNMGSSKNIYQKDTCLKEIELHALNTITILNSVVNTIGGGGEGRM